MEGDELNPTGSQTDDTTTAQAATDAQPPAQGAAPPAAQPPAQATPAPARSTITVPTAAMSRIKREERNKGQEQLAKELGFESVEAMKRVLAAKEKAKKPAAAPAAAPRSPGAPARPTRPAATAPEPDGDETAATAQPTGDDPDRQARINRIVRDRARLKRENEELKERLDTVQAEGELKLIALRIGITDVDYALALLKRHFSTLDEAAAAQFDESAYFEGLRKTHPVIFATTEITRPAQSTTGGATPAQNPAGARPPAPPSNRQPSDAAPVDARKMTKQELDEHLRKRGLQNPTNAAY